MRHCVDIRAVLQSLVQDHVHHAQRQRAVRAGPDRDVPVGQCSGSRPVWVNHNQTCAVASRLFNERPQVHIVSVDIRTPRKHQLGQLEVLSRCAKLLAIHQVPRHAASLTANGSIQLACAHAVKEAAVHRPVAQHADGAGIAVRQNRLGPELGGNVSKARGNRVQRLIPAHALEGLMLAASFERAFGNARLALQRVENPLRCVHAVEILGHLSAEKTLRHGVCRVARNFHCAPLFVYGDQHPAGVRAIVRTNGMHNAKSAGFSSRGHSAIVS